MTRSHFQTHTLRGERGSSVVEPLVAAVLLVTALAPLGGALYHVTFSTTAEDAVLASVTAASVADLARVDCTTDPAPQAPRPSWSVRVAPAVGAGARAIVVEVVGRDGLVLSSVSAPCLPTR